MDESVNVLQAFSYNAQPLRFVERGGQPWFVLNDVCRILEIKTPGDVSARLDDDEKGMEMFDTPGGKQSILIINESGLYSTIVRSNKPEAKPFRKWVTSEVLPSIRQQGFYEVPGGLKPRRAASQPSLTKHYYTSVTCNVCSSDHAHRIDQMLVGNLVKQDGKRFTLNEIIVWGQLQGLKLSKAGISRHRTRHLMPRLNQPIRESDRGGMDGALRRMMREMIQEVLVEALGEVQYQYRQAAKAKNKRDVQSGKKGALDANESKEDV